MRLVSPDAESATASLIGAGGTVLAEDDALTIGSLRAHPRSVTWRPGTDSGSTS